MGLSIIAIEKVTLTEPHTFSDACWEANHHRAFTVDDAFPASLAGLQDGRCYVSEQDTEAFDFGASYGGYGDWRAELCKRALDVPAEAVWANEFSFRDEPFYELINFADNEGTIGPFAAANLAVDFRTHADRVRYFATETTIIDIGDGFAIGAESSFDGLYDCFSRAFTLAAPHGMVLFA